MMKKYQIGVAGVGMVGAQVKRWFEENGYKVFAHDRFKKIGKLTDLYLADVVFLCLPTPHDSKNKMGVDITFFSNFVRNFRQGKTFVIKSTVPPGMTDLLQKKFPKHKFFHSPEFLTEVTAWRDFSEPVFQLLGYTKRSKSIADDVLAILPSSKYARVLPAIATEIFKFTRNAFFAVKLSFVNHIYDICKSMGAEYDALKELMFADPWIGGHHLEAVHKGYRGFGGKCLPKDLKTFIKIFDARGERADLLKAADQFNCDLLERQKLTETLNKYWLGNYNEPKK